MPLDIKPGPGTLSASMFENEALGIWPGMVFSIAVPVTVPFGGKKISTEIRLDFIRISAHRFEDMESSTYCFPVNPDRGYIEGSIYLGNVHNPVDCTRLTFGKAASGSLKAEMELSLDFEYEGPEELGVVETVITADLAFERKALDKVFLEAGPDLKPG
jgi:hypothetical protein